jgi:ribosomal protein S18 acetylase RimI-like enzyme
MTYTTTKSKSTNSHASLTFRPGTVADSYAVFRVFEETLADLNQRFGSTTPTSWQEPRALGSMWAERRSLYEHLAQTAESFWVAEQDDQVVGFSRSILQDGVRELTELFVLPGVQSGGVGRELLARAVPAEEAKYLSIISSADVRAQALYLKAGVYPRFPIYYFGRSPKVVSVTTDLVFEPISASPENLEMLASLDRSLLGYRRDATHAWLLGNRQGYLFYRDKVPVGYGYVGARNGPFALIDVRDFPAVLARAESEAAKDDRDEFGLEVPMINRAAVDYLLAHGFHMDSFMAISMSNVPFGKFENYILPSPPFFL